MKINEHDRVALRHALPERGLEKGDVGVVVHIYPDAKGYEVEFMDGEGDTVFVITLEPGVIRPLTHLDMPHVRTLSARQE